MRAVSRPLNISIFITRELNRYIPVPFLILGSIGNLTNILVFTRPVLRTNPCSIYFICSSIVNFFSLYVGLITPFLGLYNLDARPKRMMFYARSVSIFVIQQSHFQHGLFSSPVSIGIYQVQPNVNTRSWSSLHVAKRFVCLASLICFLIPYTQVFYCYTVSTKKVCTYQNQICKLLNDIILLLCNSGFPPILMVILSILTIRNVKDTNLMANQHRRHRRRDAQLIRILLIQVSILVLFAIPVAIQKLYTSSTGFIQKNALTTAIDSLITQISIEISYITNSTAFYVYSLTSKKYRKEVIHILSAAFKCKQNMNFKSRTTDGRLEIISKINKSCL